MGKIWVNFYNKQNGKKLGGYVHEGSFKGKMQATRALKAYENKLELYEVDVKYEKE